MSSDTDTSDTTGSESSSSSVDYKKRKSGKKHKNKSEKKLKKQKKTRRHKDKKHSKKELPKVKASSGVPNMNDDSFGPALPPHLQQKPETVSATAPAVIGPVLPTNFIIAEKIQPNTSTTIQEDDDFGYGPMPSGSEMSAAQVEREQRALELKIAAIEGRGLSANTNDQKSREEWMLELPEVGLRGGLAALSNMKRTFHAGKEKPDFSDRSSWTKTPQSESSDSSQIKAKPNVQSLKSKAEAIYERDRDAEQDRLAKKHKKKHKREESLMELHQKKLRKEQKQKEKELAASGSKPERRPFSRDVDLKLNKIDKHQTKQIVDKAKILDSKFSTGKTKYL